MEFSNIESVSQPVFGFIPQADNFQLPSLVSKRLTRPSNVPINFIHDIILGESCIAEHEVDRLLAGPPLRVHPGVYDETARSPRVE